MAHYRGAQPSPSSDPYRSTTSPPRTAELCDRLITQYEEARVAVRERMSGSVVVETATSRGRPEKETAGDAPRGERPALGLHKERFAVPEDFDAPLDEDLLRT